MGGDEGVTHCQAGQQRDDKEERGLFRPAGNGKSQGNQDNQACIEEYRDGYYHAGKSQRPGGTFFSKAADHRQCHTFRAARDFQDCAEHGTQSDQQSDSLQRFTHAFVDGIDDHRDRHSADQTDTKRGNQNGNQRLELSLDNQEQQNC